MGGETSKKPEPKKDDVMTVIFQMKMTSKRLSREAKRCEKEQQKNLKKVEATLKKGDEESARMYVENSQRNKMEARRYQTLASKLDAMAGRIKSNAYSTDVMKHLTYNVTPVLQKEANNMNLEQLCMNLENFQEAFDKMEINANIANQNFSNMAYNGMNTDETDNLMQQMKAKVTYDMAKDNGMEIPLQETQQTAPVKEKTKDDAALDDFIEGLKK